MFARLRNASWITVALVIALSLVATPGHALRHLRLVRSYPAADTVLVSSPDAVRLWLSEAAEMPTMKITMTTAAGASVKLGRVTRTAGKDAPVVAPLLAPVKAGTYNVAWRTMSRDGHVVKGTYAFRIRAPAARAK